MTNRTMVSFRLPDDLVQNLRERADAEGTNVTELVCRLLKQGLQSKADESVVTLVDEQVDKRIAPLEERLEELQQRKHASAFPYALPPYYPYPAPPVNLESLEQRLEQRFEELMSKLAFQNQSHLELLKEKVAEIERSIDQIKHDG